MFRPIVYVLLDGGDKFRHLADLTAYAAAQARVGSLYTDHEAWSRKAVMNVACSGRSSSDRTITDYARQIWNGVPVPVP